MKTLDVNRNGQINIVEYAARAKEFVKKRILLTFLLQLKARGNNLYQKIYITQSFKCSFFRKNSLKNSVPSQQNLG